MADPCGPPLPAWARSSRSGYNGNCVEVLAGEEHVYVRDSKDRKGPCLAFSRQEWAAFTASLKAPSG